MRSGVIIVSNRLPVSIKRRDDGQLEVTPSAGGLATGLASYAEDKRNKWIGWPGIATDELDDKDRSFVTSELKKHNCYPVFLTKNQVDNYYNGFANSVLWPAFHEMQFNAKPPEKWWRAMREVNKIFADETLKLSAPGSDIWVHDYQIPLVPSLLRQKRPHDKIGFFLHIPFPRYATFSKIPHYQQVLNGFLGSDLLGFHTPDYVKNFLDCAEATNVGAVGPRKLILPNRVIRVDDFPMGIDYNKFANTARGAAVKAETIRLRTKYGRKKIILTVDRLDPTKGLRERLKAYRQFLRENPAQRGKVVMVMLAVPSRTDIPKYKRLKNDMEQLVDETNQEFGTLRWQPVDYMFKSLPFTQLSALYRVADIAFITPIKDGMNLVAKEYLASQPDNHGILILSETAGAAGELKNAILVNPHQPSTLVHGLRQAVVQPSRQLYGKSKKMRQYLAKSTVQNWAGNFMETLQQNRPRGQQIGVTRQLNDKQLGILTGAYQHSRYRHIFLDYDGVLTSLVPNPDDAKPDQKLKKILTDLCQDESNRVTVISGRNKSDLTKWLGDIAGLGLVAEHGAATRKPGQKTWSNKKVTADWYKSAEAIMQKYTAQTPGSHVETKSAGLVWHYRRAKPYYAQKSLLLLRRKLSSLANQHNLIFEQGNKILEIRDSGVDKGDSALRLIADKNDFILAIGDDTTDEAMFEKLPSRAFTLKVGPGRTQAHYRLKNVAAVRQLLTDLTKSK